MIYRTAGALALSLLLFSVTVTAQTTAQQAVSEKDRLLNAEWALISTSPFGARDGHEVVKLSDNTLIMMGGETASGAMNDVWRSEDEGRTWQRVLGNAGWDPRRDFAAAVSSGDVLYVFPGNNPGSTSRAQDVWKSENGGESWVKTFDFAGIPGFSTGLGQITGGQAIVLPNNDILFMGGRTLYNNYINTVWRSQNGGQSFSELSIPPDQIWPGRAGHQLVKKPDPFEGDRLFIIGGYNSDTGSELTDVWRSTNNGTSWVLMTSNINVSVGRDHSAGVLSNGNLYLVTGDRSRNATDVFVSSIGINWSVSNDGREFPGRSQAASTAFGTDILLIGGRQTHDDEEQLRERLHFNTLNGQTVVSGRNAGFAARSGHAAATAGNGTVFIAGGDDQSGPNPVDGPVDAWYSETAGEGNWQLAAANFTASSSATVQVARLSDGSLLSIEMNGINASGSRLRISADGASWSSAENLGTTIPTRRFFGMSALGMNVIGTGGRSGTTARNDVWRINGQNGVPEVLVANAPWQARLNHGQVTLADGTIMIAGGRINQSSSTNTYLNDVWTSANGGLTWTQRTADAAWEIRYGLQLAALPGGGVVLMGGSQEFTGQGFSFNDIWYSGDQGANWELITENAPWQQRAKAGLTFTESGDLLWIGGEVRPQQNTLETTVSDEVWLWEIGVPSAESGSIQVSIPGPAEGWRMMGSPVQQSSYGDLFGTLWMQGFPGANQGSGGEPNVFFHNAAAPSETAFTAPAHVSDMIGHVPGSSSGSSGRGALIYVYEDERPFNPNPAFWPKSVGVNGLLNNDIVVFPLGIQIRNDGWNLVSNPYPFTIDAAALLADSENIAEVIYVWDANASAYLTFGGSPAFNQFDGRLAPFQGFWVQALSANPQPRILFRPEQRVGTELIPFGGDEPADEPVVILEVNGAERSVRAGFSVGEGSHTGGEGPGTKDVWQLGSLHHEYLHLFTEAADGTPLRFQHLSEGALQGGALSIPLHVQTTGSEPLELSIPMMHHMDAFEILLTDTETGQQYELEEGFSLNLGTIAPMRQLQDRVSAAELLSQTLAVPAEHRMNSNDVQARFQLSITLKPLSGLPDVRQLPARLTLGQNYPNPFNPTTRIPFTLPEAGHVNLTVYDSIGRVVQVLTNENLASGSHSVRFDGSSLSSGVYLYRLSTAAGVLTQTMVFVK
ncbi:MAG: T9SS type A sorting domain-containing protein [Candidatus Cyclonatronum sp.]|uniref:T9SS type A sorting domain-containing protein n=1 Tax=Cyclonatronum sp. TaxID=3024185 RepID=UPI0025BD3512|nr:T9SS type A sorting domain-containing protein [Cyclonatronum sp.]MCH8486478.1 T9SS type A sorting domain-containing protein [Cyclonatronum sp.]